MLEKYWFLLIAVAAVSHAVWNFLLKQSGDKDIALWFLRIWAFMLTFPVSLFFWTSTSLPIHTWAFWGLGSILLHGTYAVILAKAYTKSDFTLAYPVARGTGPLLVVLIGWAFLKENVSIFTLFGAFLIFIGMYILYAGLNLKAGARVFKSVLQTPYPILVGMAIAGYTVFDKLAIAVIPPVTLNNIENFGQVCILAANVRHKSKTEIVKEWRNSWRKMALAGGLSAFAYILALLVLTKIPVSHVAPVRESSIIIGPILAFIFLKEAFSVQKVVGSVVIFLGVVTIVLS